MGPLEKRNKWIIQKAKEIIERKGLTGYLEMEPIPNKFKYRPRLYRDKATKMAHFIVLMWEVNKLSDEECLQELERLIDAARDHFFPSLSL